MLNYYDTVFGDGVIRPAAGCASSGGLLCFLAVRREAAGARKVGRAINRHILRAARKAGGGYGGCSTNRF